MREERVGGEGKGVEGKLEGRKREEKNWGKRSEERKKGLGESGGGGGRLLFNTSHRFF